MGSSKTAQRTPWHVSKVFTYTHDGNPGSAIASGIDIATVPDNYNAVIEHMSARCVAPPALVTIYGEVLVSGNPSDPGQSGVPGAPPQEDTANHLFLFQTSYSGSPTVYVASQQVKLYVNAPTGRIRFIGDFLNSGSEPAVITCLFSISGYLEKQ